MNGFSSRHAGGCQFLWADGGVRLVKNFVDAKVFSALATRDGGEIVGVDAF